MYEAGLRGQRNSCHSYICLFIPQGQGSNEGVLTINLLFQMINHEFTPTFHLDLNLTLLLHVFWAMQNIWLSASYVNLHQENLHFSFRVFA